MEVLAIDKQLYHDITQLTGPQKIALSNMIKTFLNDNDEMFGPMTIEEYNRELDEAEAEFERGETVSHKEVKKMVKKWQEKV